MSPSPAAPSPAQSPAPREVRAEQELSLEEIRAQLAAPARDPLLARLGIREQDAADLVPVIEAALADEEILAEVARIANQLGAAAGLDVPALDLAARKDELDALGARLAPGEGLIPILAFLVSTGTVRRWHAARGLTTEQSWLVLADLGQQMRVHRAGTGRLGLHQLNWVTMNWAGRLVQLGRLQFDLHRARTATLDGAGRDEEASAVPPQEEPRERWVIGTHIPATGPLDPAAVGASFAEATAYFTAHYPDLAEGREPGDPAFGHEFTCWSWLISEEFAEITGPGSNLARFAARWEVLKEIPDDGDSALFFCFGLRPPQDLRALPRRTRLERGVADRLADGRGWTSGLGRIIR
ncbi:acyltransferase domain-containing protein [Brachybacterium hainanense]|uniref:Acyltransferase domain-containing protein n=1 Tax=Brachybacterium hainanense TaxID=1541174 RepID=A0ABV6RE92_9MICO